MTPTEFNLWLLANSIAAEARELADAIEYPANDRQTLARLQLITRVREQLHNVQAAVQWLDDALPPF